MACMAFSSSYIAASYLRPLTTTITAGRGSCASTLAMERRRAAARAATAVVAITTEVVGIEVPLVATAALRGPQREVAEQLIVVPVAPLREKAETAPLRREARRELQRGRREPQQILEVRHDEPAALARVHPAIARPQARIGADRLVFMLPPQIQVLRHLPQLAHQAELGEQDAIESRVAAHQARPAQHVQPDHAVERLDGAVDVDEMTKALHHVVRIQRRTGRDVADVSPVCIDDRVARVSDHDLRILAQHLDAGLHVLRVPEIIVGGPHEELAAGELTDM